ncbi:MAG: hypothetical protein BWZ02_00447 [Lentisphaerae bacterium ADurb.BinA184]|nr:MAG: hypothetical protein BWZ02_00447 [Lentisphaerae bacterium ADurb.BinA184]
MPSVRAIPQPPEPPAARRVPGAGPGMPGARLVAVTALLVFANSAFSRDSAAAGVRDPFFWPAVPAAPATVEAEVLPLPKEDEGAKLAALVSRLRFDGLIRGETGDRLAILNGDPCRAGADVKVVAGGETFVLRVLKIQVEPPAVVLGYNGEEQVLALSPKPEKGD